MKLLKQTSNQCLIYSLAMVLNVTVDEIISKLGHDGLLKVWPLSPPECFAGVNMQEAIDVCDSYGIGLRYIEPMPASGVLGRPELTRNIFTADRVLSRLEIYLMNHTALLIGMIQGSFHCVAWDGQLIYDPNGKIYKIEEFSFSEAWILYKLDYKL